MKESPHENVVQCLPDILYLIDMSGKFIFVSDAVKRLGFDPSQLAGKHFNSIVHPEDLPQVQRDSVLPSFRKKITGAGNAPLLFDERRTGGRVTRNLSLRVRTRPGGAQEPTPEFRVCSTGFYEYRGNRKKELIGTLGIMRETGGALPHFQDERYLQIFQHTTEIVTLLAHDGTILFKNNSVKKILGLLPEDLIGANEFEYLHDDDLLLFSSVLTNAIAGVSPAPAAEFRYRHKNGSWKIFESDIKKIQSPDGIAICFLVNSRDVTEFKSAKQTISETGKKFRAIIDQLSEVIMVISGNGTIEYVSRSVEAILGYSQYYLVAKNIRELFRPEDRGALAARTTGIPHDNRHIIMKNMPCLHANGTWRIIDLTLSNQLDEPGICGVILTLSDITEKKETEEALKTGELKYKNIIETIGEGYYEVDTLGTFTFCNNSFCRIFGSSREEIIGRNINALITPDALSLITDTISTALTSGKKSSLIDLKIIHKDGSRHYAGTSVDVITDSKGARQGYRGIMRDITEIKSAEKALRESEKKYRTLYQTAIVGMITADISLGLILATNDMGYALFGYESRFTMIGETIADRFADRQAYENLIASLNADTLVTSREVLFIKINGDQFWAEISARMYPEEDVIDMVMIDITRTKKNEENIFRLTHYDVLTGLPNKQTFGVLLRNEMLKTHRFAVMCIGIDKFKDINDIYSPAVGDALLKDIAMKLREIFFQKDIVSRFEGDKFMVLLSEIGLSDSNVNIENIDKIAKKTRGIFTLPFNADGNSIGIAPSIGICVYPDDGEDPAALMKNSETAMYFAKEKGGNVFHYYDAQLNDKMRDRLLLEKDLVMAIQNDEFIVFYQPKVGRDGSISGMEALVRWRSAKRGGIIPPLEYIPLAEKNGLIVDIGLIVLEKSCEQNVSWQRKGLGPFRIAVNLSPCQFSQADLIDEIRNILTRTGMDPAQLELEITESGIMANEKESVEKLREIHDMGIAISIDDFGTGYSSLSRLRVYPIDTLKIDKSFIDHIPGDRMSSIIATTIIDLAHNLGFKVVAEGVENAGQIEFLRNHQCDQFQGYYYFKPLPHEEIEERLKKKV